MAIKATIGGYLSKHVLEPFAQKPGLHLPKGTVNKDLTVAERVGGKLQVDHFVQTGKTAVNAQTGVKFDMIPVVEGGFQPGDIVMRGNSLVTTAESGLVTTVYEGLAHSEWQIRKSAVSHAGIVVKDASGEMRVIQMISGETPKELEHLLTSRQKKLGATFLHNDSLDAFFNSKKNPFTQATVMRPQDPAMAERAAKTALDYYHTQVTPSGTHPWYSRLPHSMAPDGRGGVCSTFVDEAYGGAFNLPYHLPTTPEQFVQSTLLVKVGDKAITDIKASGQAAQGTLVAK